MKDQLDDLEGTIDAALSMLDQVDATPFGKLPKLLDDVSRELNAAMRLLVAIKRDA